MLTVKEAINLDLHLYNAAVDSKEINVTTSTLISSALKLEEAYTLDYTLKFILIVLPKRGALSTKLSFEYGAKGKMNPEWYRWYLVYFTG